MTGSPFPTVKGKEILIFAADHGVADRRVSAYPKKVTVEMVRNFARGGAAINVLANAAGARLSIVNVGSVGPNLVLPGVQEKRVRAGTNDCAIGPAMSRAEAFQAIRTGKEIVDEAAGRGLDVLAVGEMGIGNTTIASAITAVVLGVEPEEVTGAGTGLDREGIQRKVAIVKQAIQVNSPDRENPLDILHKIGGFEIGALAGAMLAAASKRIPVVLDGFITGAAALIACGIAPALRDYLIAGHISPEPGHRLQLGALRLSPLLRLDMRLGEGSGAAIALGLLDSACRLCREMHTFGEARVSTAIPAERPEECREQARIPFASGEAGK